MNRRIFVTGLGAVLAMPLNAEPQLPSGRTALVGLLLPGPASSPISIRGVENFTQGLRETGM